MRACLALFGQGLPAYACGSRSKHVREKGKIRGQSRWPPERHHVVARVALAMARPRVHNLAPPRQRIRSPVGLFGLVADDMRERMLASSRGKGVSFPAQSRNACGSRARSHPRSPSTATPFPTPCLRAGLPGRWPGKRSREASPPPLPEDRDGGLAKRNAMLAPRLHPPAGRVQPRREIDFRPSGFEASGSASPSECRIPARAPPWPPARESSR